MNIFATQLAAIVEVNSDRPALIDSASQATLSFGDLGQKLEQFATMQPRKSKSGRTTILSALPDSVETLVLFLAAGASGADFLAIDPQMPAAEIRRILALVDVDIAFVARTTSTGLRRELSEARIEAAEVQLEGGYGWLQTSREAKHAPIAADNALLILTSGSTGEPKLLRMPFNNLWSQARLFSMCHRFIGPGSRMLNAFSMSYLGGLLNGCLVPLSAGGSVVVADRAVRESPAKFWHDVRRHDVDIAWLFPTHIRELVRNGEMVGPALYDAAASRLKAVFTGMAPISGDLKARFQDMFGVPCLENYALSETGFIATETVEMLGLSGRDNAGPIIPGVHLSFIDGELSVRTPYAFSGYVTAKGATTGAGESFATGDLGELDRYGRIVLKGRSKEIVKRADQLVYLREIELTAESSAEVARCAAVRVDDEGSESFDLFIERRDPTYPFTSIASWLHSVLPTSKWPRSIRKMDEMPVALSGKIRKGMLKGGEARGSSR